MKTPQTLQLTQILHHNSYTSFAFEAAWDDRCVCREVILTPLVDRCVRVASPEGGSSGEEV